MLSVTYSEEEIGLTGVDQQKSFKKVIFPENTASSNGWLYKKGQVREF